MLWRRIMDTQVIEKQIKTSPSNKKCLYEKPAIRKILKPSMALKAAFSSGQNSSEKPH